MSLNGLDEKTRDELAALALQLSSDPKTRKTFLKTVKTALPATAIPEVDSENALTEELAKRDKEIEELKNGFTQYKLQNDLSAARGQAKEKFGLSDEDVGKMEKMMQEKQLPADYNWAGQLYKAQTEQATPTNFGSGGWGPAEMPADEGLMADENKWSLKTAHSLVDELRKRAS